MLLMMSIALKFGVVLFSLIAILLNSVLIFVACSNACLAGRKNGNGLAVYWGILILVAAVFLGGLAVGKTFVFSGVFEEKLSEGRSRQREVKEILVQNVPELNDADLKDLTFAMDGKEAIAQYHDSTIVIEDTEAFDYVESYFEKYQEYDYTAEAEEQVAMLALVGAWIISLAGSYAGIVMFNHFAPKLKMRRMKEV